MEITENFACIWLFKGIYVIYYPNAVKLVWPVGLQIQAYPVNLASVKIKTN